MLGGSGFFLEAGVSDADELIDGVYELARFWRVDPEIEMTRPVSIIVEHFKQANRINRVTQEA